MLIPYVVKSYLSLDMYNDLYETFFLSQWITPSPQWIWHRYSRNIITLWHLQVLFTKIFFYKQAINVKRKRNKFCGNI